MGSAGRYNGAQPERLVGSNVHRAPRFSSTSFYPARSRGAGGMMVCPTPEAYGENPLRYSTSRDELLEYFGKCVSRIGGLLVADAERGHCTYPLK
jgi:hypothetical protein